VACIAAESPSVSAIHGTDHAAKTVNSCNQGELRRVKGGNGTILAARALTQRRPHQAMISAIIVITLLSLLVATEPEPAGSSVHPSPEPPLRPAGQKSPEAPARPDQLAA